MAMYYYASKLSIVACGIRCRQTARKNRKNQNKTDTDDEKFYANQEKQVNIFNSKTLPIISCQNVENYFMKYFVRDLKVFDRFLIPNLEHFFTAKLF